MANSSIARTTLGFAVLGPGIGAVAFGIYTWVAYIAHGGTLSSSNWQIAAAILVWSYALTVLPAAVTGIAWSCMFKRMPSLRASLIVRATVGVVTGSAIAALAGFLMEGLSSLDRPHFVVAFAFCGAVSGGLLAGIFPLARWEPPPPSNVANRLPG